MGVGVVCVRVCFRLGCAVCVHVCGSICTRYMLNVAKLHIYIFISQPRHIMYSVSSNHCVRRPPVDVVGFVSLVPLVWLVSLVGFLLVHYYYLVVRWRCVVGFVALVSLVAVGGCCWVV